MLTPGLLRDDVRVSPLKRISPSRYNSLLECSLREVLSAKRQAPLLPSSPAARIGSVIHSLLEEAGKGLLPPDSDEITNRWDVLIADLESKLRENWLDTSCVPFSKTVRDYDLKRLRAIRKAEEIATGCSGPIATSSSTNNEVWVQSQDGLLAGSIDFVEHTAEGPKLRDYKTGQIFEGEEIKTEYKLQLKLYAALYKQSVGEWPIGLQIEPLGGQNVEVEFTPEECTKLLFQAVSDLNAVNQLIGALNDATTQSSSMRALATPSPQKCKFCVFRPACGPYLRDRPRQEPEGWPIDLLGKVSEITQLNNGRLLLAIETSLGTMYVRGLTNSAYRHPALPMLSRANSIGMFNLQKTPATDTFSESPQTVIYKYDYEA